MKKPLSRTAGEGANPGAAGDRRVRAAYTTGDRPPSTLIAQPVT
jgi:hypothetical protein